MADDLSFLPSEIKQVLKRKSSRDPSSRFPSKLHLLLNFVSNSQIPDIEEKVGCSWVTDEEFRINKKTITQVLGIKLNSLNVNLHTLKFQQQKHNKDGWTLWKKQGFTRTSNSMEGSNPQQTGQAGPYQNFGNIGSNPYSMGYGRSLETAYAMSLQPIRLGKMNDSEKNYFFQNAHQIWNELGFKVDAPPNSEYFMNKAAESFKQPEQPLSNAKDVLNAIITPESSPNVTFKMFCSFLAMFGPKNTIMLKIASLLQCSNNNGQWLTFNKPERNSLLYGVFDENEPNCLTIYQMGKTINVWNLPNVSADRNYVIDSSGNTYKTWEEYFNVNPIH